MATKLYNSHLNDILLNCKEYYILDTYIALVHISSEVNSKYLIQTYSNSKSDLINIVKKYLKVSYKTIFNCIDRLISRNILAYNTTLNSWQLVNMENMVKSKDLDCLNENRKDFTGYTHMRNFFFSEDFANMKAREKRLMIYMAQLSDSKSANFHENFKMNLLRPNSTWLKILRTKCKYYAKYTIEKLLEKYAHLFTDNSELKRNEELAPIKSQRFKFFFNCDVIRKKSTDNDIIELVKSNNSNDFKLIMEKIRFAEVTLSKQKIMHLIRSISNLKEWFLKERVVQIIINKYRAIQIHQSRENIKSISAYAAAVVKNVVDEFNEFKLTMKNNKLKYYELGEHFVDYSKNDNNLNNINSNIRNILNLF
ncbi:MAG: hypothetical protein ACRC7R_11070 [Sarcina sp.]